MQSMLDVYNGVVQGTLSGFETEILEVPAGAEVIGRRAFRFLDGHGVRAVILPDGLTTVKESAFEGLKKLKMVYIPRSVEIIEENAFKNCPNLKIYCEGEPSEKWVNGEIVRTEVDYYTSPEDDAFNFHRSSGSWTSTKIERSVKKFVSYNPDGLPVVTNVNKERFIALSTAGD